MRTGFQQAALDMLRETRGRKLETPAVQRRLALPRFFLLPVTGVTGQPRLTPGAGAALDASSPWTHPPAWQSHTSVTAAAPVVRGRVNVTTSLPRLALPTSRPERPLELSALQLKRPWWLSSTLSVCRGAS